jgi:hypothetical protein
MVRGTKSTTAFVEFVDVQSAMMVHDTLQVGIFHGACALGPSMQNEVTAQDCCSLHAYSLTLRGCYPA